MATYVTMWFKSNCWFKLKIYMSGVCCYTLLLLFNIFTYFANWWWLRIKINSLFLNMSYGFLKYSCTFTISVVKLFEQFNVFLLSVQVISILIQDIREWIHDLQCMLGSHVSHSSFMCIMTQHICFLYLIQRWISYHQLPVTSCVSWGHLYQCMH